MNETLQQVLPVVISIVIIILIAVLQVYSKTLAAITATMPLTVPLTLWIVYAAEDGNRSITVPFIESMLVGVVATLIFVVAIWLAARAGLSLIPMLIVGYLAWGIVLGLNLIARSYL